MRFSFALAHVFPPHLCALDDEHRRVRRSSRVLNAWHCMVLAAPLLRLAPDAFPFCGRVHLLFLRSAIIRGGKDLTVRRPPGTATHHTRVRSSPAQVTWARLLHFRCRCVGMRATSCLSPSMPSFLYPGVRACMGLETKHVTG